MIVPIFSLGKSERKGLAEDHLVRNHGRRQRKDSSGVVCIHGSDP